MSQAFSFGICMCGGLSMEGSGTQIGLGAMFLFLLLCLPYLSTADDIYRPDEVLSINCGTSNNFSTIDARNWTGDIKFLVQNHDSVAASADTTTTIQGPYTYARLSHSQFNYSFPVTPGTPKFLRLFFYSTSYQKFDRPKAYFSVKAGPYTLLNDFNASLNADNDKDPSNPDILFREYCIYPEDGQNKLNITFIPSNADSYAFINGIEIVSMPLYLYYTNPDAYSQQPQVVGTTDRPFNIQKNFSLETMYRLTVGREIPPAEDTGMLRNWESDINYLPIVTSKSFEYGNSTKLTFTTMTPNYTAPDKVYKNLRNIGTNPTFNKGFNLTWLLPVDSGFNYFLRLHFCQLDPRVAVAGQLLFYIYVADQLATDSADVLLWTDNQKGVPVVKDYVLILSGNHAKKLNLSLKIHPRPESAFQDATLNGIELFKISDPETASLAGPNPQSQTHEVPLQGSNNKSNSTNKRTLIAAVAAAFSGVVLLSLIVAFFLIKRQKNFDVDNNKDGTSRGGGSSSLPTNLCRRFSFAEIRAATNNFNEIFIVGTGGFGNVYKGYIDDGSTRVAIKRLKPGSQQGAQEFVNEIEMLSQLRHLNLVSLIGYCYDSNEMILVYEFMDRGTLREYLCDTDNPSLSWKQRLQICIGAARGLHYLHTGAKHMIIHRDVKSTNILLDEKWMAKVSDFGLSRIGPTGSSMTHVSTEVKGSFGYLDPEYYKRQRLTEKSDVYSFGVVLLEALSGKQPLFRTAEKKKVSLADWAKHLYEKGSLGEFVDPALKGQIATQCLHKFGEVALSCLLENGSHRPSMKDVVGVLEFVLQLQDTTVNGVAPLVVSGGRDYEDSEDMFSSSHSSIQLSEYSNSTGLNTTSSGSKESDRLIVPENVFSEIKDPKGR